MSEDDDVPALFECAMATLNAFAKEVRKRDLCPLCASNVLSQLFTALAAGGAIQHTDDYQDDKRETSPFFADEEFASEISRAPGSRAH